MALHAFRDKAIGHFRRYNKKTLGRLSAPGLEREKLCYLDSVGLLASAGNRMLLQSSMPNKGQIRAWDRLMVPLARVVDPVFAYRLGKTVLGAWRRRAGG